MRIPASRVSCGLMEVADATARDGYGLAAMGHLEQAEKWFQAHAPDERYALAVIRLALGRYAEAVDDYDLRPSRYANMPWPHWRGEDLFGKRLAIFPEQGLGDAIQFARFAPLLQRRGADVTLLCRPQLTRLFAQLDVRVLSAVGAVDFPDPDYWVRANSLIRCCASADAVPSEPYLSAEPRLSAGGLGVAWRGNAQHPNDEHRSLPEALGHRLLSLPGAIELSPEATGASDMLETAEIIAGLDLVVSVDTSVAHLAGAMGKAVWVLLPSHNTDWRWMRGRSDSPWYPSATLYRQSGLGWDSLLDRVIEDVHATF